MGAVAAVKQALGLPISEIGDLEKRIAVVDSDLSDTQAEQTKAETDLAECERRGETKAADAAAARLHTAEEKLARLRVRRGAVTSALNEARAAKTASDLAAKIEAEKIALADATKAADAAQSKVIAQLVALSRSFEEFREASTAERVAHSALSRDAEAPHFSPRYLSTIEDDARRIVGTFSTFEVKVPTK